MSRPRAFKVRHWSISASVSIMRTLLFGFGIAIVIQASAGTPARVDGIDVYGKLSEVSETDIHDVLTEYSRIESTTPSAIEVVSNSEVRVHPQSPDRGWIPMRHLPMHYPDGRIVPTWISRMFVIWEIPEALHLIGSAKDVYVFPVPIAFKPHMDNSHLRLLDVEARVSLERLLGNKESWFHGIDNTMWPSGVPVPADVGFLFKEDKSEVVLYCMSGLALFDGQRSGGTLERSVEHKLAEWEHQYAQPELSGQREQ